MEPIVNRVAQSEIQVFDLEELWDGKQILEFDLAPFLYEGLIVRGIQSGTLGADATLTGDSVISFCGGRAIQLPFGGTTGGPGDPGNQVNAGVAVWF